MTAAAGKAAPSLATLVSQRGRRARLLAMLLGIVIVLLMLASIATGAVPIPPLRVIETLRGVLAGDSATLDTREALIIVQIRLPRTLLALLIGACLATSGALMQGLLRNPLADPGLVGVSSGAGLGAAVAIVLGDRLFGRIDAIPYLPSVALLPATAFIGGLASTIALYLIATRAGRTGIATLILAGVALAALSGAGIGLLSFISDDRQLRDLTFWSLGSLGGANWGKVGATALGSAILLFASAFLARGLNALTLGEAEAFHLGLPIERIKRVTILVVALAIGASVAAAGAIGFIGLVVPHLLRLVIGPDNRLLLPFSALGGGALLLAADILARIVASPAELPIGIVTALIGAPFFLGLLLKQKRDAEAI